MVARKVTITFGAGMLIGLAASVISIAGASTAAADGLTCQSGCGVDYDGTQGGFDFDGTNGASRGLATSSSDGHDIVSDACFVIGQGCPPPASFDPTSISETQGVADDPDSALDADGYQADHTSGPAVVATAPPAANLPRGYYHN